MRGFGSGKGQAGVPNYPEWICLRKVCYRVGEPDQPEWIHKVNMAINANMIVQAPLSKDGNWIMDPANDYLLPLRHPETKEFLWAVMEDIPGPTSHGAIPPDGITVCKLPPSGLPVFPEENAPPGGIWVEEPYCGPASLACITFPCCWPVFCSLNPKCTGIDHQAIYYAPDGKRYTEWGKALGSYDAKKLEGLKKAAETPAAEVDAEEEAEIQKMMSSPLQEAAPAPTPAEAAAPAEAASSSNAAAPAEAAAPA